MTHPDPDADDRAGGSDGSGGTGGTGPARPESHAGTPAAGRSRTRRKLSLIAIAVLVIAILVVAALLIVNFVSGDDGRPTVTATAGDETVEVEPFEYCEPQDPTDCDPPGETADVPVDAETPLTISVPDAIADAPWSLKSYYVGDGVEDFDNESVIPEEEYFTPGSTSSVEVDPVDDSGKQLVGVEVQLPTGLYDQDTGETSYISHATWSIATR